MANVEKMPAKVAAILTDNGYVHDRVIDTYTAEYEGVELASLGIKRTITIWREDEEYKVKTTYSYYEETRTYCQRMDEAKVIDCADKEEMYYDRTFVGVIRGQEKRFAEMLLVVARGEEDNAYSDLLDAIAMRCMANYRELNSYMERRGQ